MKVLTRLIGVALCCAVLPALAASDTGASTCLKRAESVLAALDAGDFDKARVDFDERMQSGLGADKLRQVWASLPQQVGERLTVAPGRSQPAADGELAIIPLQHAKAWLDLQISCAADGRVSGLFVRPGTAPTAGPAATPETSALWEERELPVVSAELSLPGTLTLPKGDIVAGAVLVHGSGAHDRDETIGPNKVFRDLAHGLAERGIAVLRYEKRSHAHPASFANRAFTVDDEVVDDAVAALQLLGRQAELKDAPIYVIGHSLGAMLAPRIASRTELAGLIMMAAPARALTDIIPQQMNYLAQLDGSVSDDERKAMSEAEASIARILAFTPADLADTAQVLGAPPAYWLDLRGYHPLVQAQGLKIPILLLQGDHDYQVTMAEDYLAWHHRLKERETFTPRSFSGLNHLFMPAGNPPSPADYEKPGHVSGEVIDAIAEWIAVGGKAQD